MAMRDEDIIQRDIVVFLDTLILSGEVWMRAMFDNGAFLYGTKWQRAWQGAKLKAMGKLKGITDLIVWHVPDKDGNDYTFIEVKRAKGYLSSAQKLIKANIEKHNKNFLLARSVNDVKQYFIDKKIITGDSNNEYYKI